MGRTPVISAKQRVSSESVWMPPAHPSMAELLCELNSQVPKSADPLDGYKVTRQCAAMSQRVKRGNAGAHQRRGLGRVERFWHPSQRFDRRDDVFLIAAVVADAANLPVRAVHEIPASARKTGTVLPAVPADSNPLAFCHSFTPAPSSSITPATSCPGTRGYDMRGKRPSFVITSL